MVADVHPPKGKWYRCELVPRQCSQVFYAFGDLEKHEKEEHPQEKKAKCKQNRSKKPTPAAKKHPRLKGKAALNQRKFMNAETIGRLAARLAAENADDEAPQLVPQPTVEEVAAVRIQTAVRAYQARKALIVLRGLSLAPQVGSEKATYAVTFYDLSSKSGLERLDYHLKTRSYISGYLASKDDITVHAALKEPPSAEHVNVSRWFNHIEALLRISGVSAQGSGVSVEGLSGCGAFSEKATDGGVAA